MGTANDKLDALAEDFAKRNNLNFFDAYMVVADQNPGLYAQAVTEPADLAKLAPEPVLKNDASVIPEHLPTPMVTRPRADIETNLAEQRTYLAQAEAAGDEYSKRVAKDAIMHLETELDVLDDDRESEINKQALIKQLAEAQEARAVLGSVEEPDADIMAIQQADIRVEGAQERLDMILDGSLDNRRAEVQAKLAEAPATIARVQRNPLTGEDEITEQPNPEIESLQVQLLRMDEVEVRKCRTDEERHAVLAKLRERQAETLLLLDALNSDPQTVTLDERPELTKNIAHCEAELAHLNPLIQELREALGL